MKKFLLGFALIFIAVFVGNSTYRAAEQGIYLKTKEVPNEAVQYTNSIWREALNAQVLLTGEDSSMFHLGQGFSISSEEVVNNNFFFPVIDNSGKISYLIEISKDGNNTFNFNINHYWVDDLNSLDSQTDSNNPIQLIEKNGRLFTEKNGIINLLNDRFNPKSNSTNFETPSVESNESDIVNNICKISSSYQENKIQSRAVTSEQATYNMNIANNFDIWEYQQDLPWCEAYALAGILNYKAGDEVTNSEKIMKWIYPKKSATDLKKVGTQTADIVRYAQSFGYKKTVNEKRAFNFEEIKKHVNSNDPMIAVLKWQNDPKGSRHAVDVLGWLEPPKSSPQPKMMYIWNPWYQMTSPMSYTDSREFVLNTGKANWETTTYNFVK